MIRACSIRKTGIHFCGTRAWAPDSFQPFVTSSIPAMMPAVVAPVVVPAVEVTDAARAVMGKDHRAAAVPVIVVRVIVIRVVIVIIRRPVTEEVPVEALKPLVAAPELMPELVSAMKTGPAIEPVPTIPS